MHCKQLIKLEMTETSCCLDCHPKFFCTVGASIFILQAHSIQKTFPWSRKSEDLFCLVMEKSISCFLLCPENVWHFFCEAGILKDHPVFWKVQQSLFCGSCMSTSYSIPSSSPGNRRDARTLSHLFFYSTALCLVAAKVRDPSNISLFSTHTLLHFFPTGFVI